MTSCGLWPFPQNLGRKVYTGSASCLRLHSARSSSWGKRHLKEMTLSSTGWNKATGSRATGEERSRGWWGWEWVKVPLWVGFMGSVPLEVSGNRTSDGAVPRGARKTNVLSIPSHLRLVVITPGDFHHHKACLHPTLSKPTVFQWLTKPLRNQIHVLKEEA